MGHLLYVWAFSILSGETTIISVIVILIHTFNDFKNVVLWKKWDDLGFLTDIYVISDSLFSD